MPGRRPDGVDRLVEVSLGASRGSPPAGAKLGFVESEDPVAASGVPLDRLAEQGQAGLQALFGGSDVTRASAGVLPSSLRRPGTRSAAAGPSCWHGGHLAKCRNVKFTDVDDLGPLPYRPRPRDRSGAYEGNSLLATPPDSDASHLARARNMPAVDRRIARSGGGRTAQRPSSHPHRIGNDAQASAPSTGLL